MHYMIADFDLASRHWPGDECRQRHWYRPRFNCAKKFAAEAGPNGRGMRLQRYENKKFGVDVVMMVGRSDWAGSPLPTRLAADTQLSATSSLTSRNADFTTFVAANYSRLLHLANLIVGDRNRAEDLLQGVLTKAYVRWPSVRQQNPVGYVRNALVNARTDSWRKRAREQPVGEFPEAQTNVDHGGLVADRDAVHRVMAALTHRERVVVVLRFYENLSVAETATVLGMRSSTVKSTCARALAKLRVRSELSDN